MCTLCQVFEKLVSFQFLKNCTFLLDFVGLHIFSFHYLSIYNTHMYSMSYTYLSCMSYIHICHRYVICRMSYIQIWHIISVNRHLQNQQEILAVNFLLKNGSFSYRLICSQILYSWALPLLQIDLNSLCVTFIISRTI